jgi:hypothetical protein
MPLEVGNKVHIDSGAVNGGLAENRGCSLHSWVFGADQYFTVSSIATHKGVREALLKEINSWVAVSSLTFAFLSVFLFHLFHCIIVSFRKKN